MADLTVTMTDVNGAQRALVVEAGLSLMEAARANGVAGIFGDCGGGCSCATCHVYVDPAWWERVGGPDDIETDMLDMAGETVRETSRLSCQIRLSPELDGLAVTVAPAA